MAITSFLMATSLPSRSYLTSKAIMENAPVNPAKSKPSTTQKLLNIKAIMENAPVDPVKLKPSTTQTLLTKHTMSHSHTLGNKVIGSPCH